MNRRQRGSVTWGSCRLDVLRHRAREPVMEIHPFVPRKLDVAGAVMFDRGCCDYCNKPPADIIHAVIPEESLHGDHRMQSLVQESWMVDLNRFVSHGIIWLALIIGLATILVIRSFMG